MSQWLSSFPGHTPSPIPHENDIPFMFLLAKCAGQKLIAEEDGYRLTAYRYKDKLYIVSMEKIT